MTFTNQPYTTVAFSGYRTSKILLSSDDNLIINTIEKKLLHTIESLYQEGARHFISGGATGFDTLAALAVAKAKVTHPDISLTLALPFQGHDAQFSSHQAADYQKIVTAADNIIYVSPQYHTRAFLNRNNYMLINSTILVCYYDGQRGGTMYTINRALKTGHKIINLHKTHQIKNPSQQMSLFSI